LVLLLLLLLLLLNKKRRWVLLFARTAKKVILLRRHRPCVAIDHHHPAAAIIICLRLIEVPRHDTSPCFTQKMQRVVALLSQVGYLHGLLGYDAVGRVFVLLQLR
jgi:hypothetical protein